MRGKHNELIVILRELQVKFTTKSTARLAAAILNGDVEQFENAIRDGGDVHGIGSCFVPWLTTSEQIIPISYCAAYQNEPAIIDLLINAGVDMIGPRSFCYLSSNVLTVALQYGNMNVVHRLVNYASVADAMQIQGALKEHQVQYLEYRGAYIKAVSGCLLIGIPVENIVGIIGEYLELGPIV
jgi:hypothetical protein